MEEKKSKIDYYKFNVEMVSFGEDDYEYMVTFDQFKEVVGAGSTQEEAIRDAKENLAAYFEYCENNNIQIPEPSTKKWIDDYSGKITVRLPKQLHRDIAIYALKDGVSLNHIINDAIRAYLCETSIFELADKAVLEINDASNYYLLRFDNLYKNPRNGSSFSNYVPAPQMTAYIAQRR